MDVGVYLYKNIVSVLSIQHQTIHLFHLQSDGTLVKVKKNELLVTILFCCKYEPYWLKTALNGD